MATLDAVEGVGVLVVARGSIEVRVLNVQILASLHDATAGYDGGVYECINRHREEHVAEGRRRGGRD